MDDDAKNQMKDLKQQLKQLKEDNPEEAAAAEAEKKVAKSAPGAPAPELPPVQEGILRFTFVEGDTPLGVSFSGGFPPMILSVKPDSAAARKGVPVNHEVHMINGIAMVQANHGEVMAGLKSRPVVIDVRPVGWKPKEKLLREERAREIQKAQEQAVMQAEAARRNKVAEEKEEKERKEAAERAEKEAAEKADKEEKQRQAREHLAKQKALEKEWDAMYEAEREDFRRVAKELLDAAYGQQVKMPEGCKGIPLRLLTRRKEVAWVWAGTKQELIGGGTPESDWT
eukprot:gnl/TRDRNA2_/TRDRNA2_136328_c3_seq2.p1 gnl/TRDRNA2_/TRDRNA2_136328_c3~~gnl/TRDRNA2_/TRDRNA2_136328_c3_seq2.p1  ORF type:complete len:333 (+),score=119.53 gnl/TRDRNA2_/TRDRNA2_136328_c3_seq2:149-1000(+)